MKILQSQSAISTDRIPSGVAVNPLRIFPNCLRRSVDVPKVLRDRIRGSCGEVIERLPDDVSLLEHPAVSCISSDNGEWLIVPSSVFDGFSALLLLGWLYGCMCGFDWMTQKVHDVHCWYVSMNFAESGRFGRILLAAVQIIQRPSQQSSFHGLINKYWSNICTWKTALLKK